jgi:hypothetical protein
MSLDGKYIFGAGGAALLRFLGGEALGLALLLVALTFWIVIPLVVAQRLLLRQDI